MKYGIIPKLMWAGYKGTFTKHLSATLSEENPRIKKFSAEFRNSTREIVFW